MNERAIERLKTVCKPITQIEIGNYDFGAAYKLAENLFQHGNLMIMIKQYDEAIERYTEALKKNPTDPSYWNNRAIAFENVGKEEESKLDLEVAEMLLQTFVEMGAVGLSLK